MANKKINQLVSKTAILSTDIFGIGDATTGQLFKKTIAELQAAIGGAVISVNGLVGTVVLDTDDIQELATPTNKYFTDARARGAISLTVTGNSGASTYSSGTGVLNVPTYTLAGLGGITAAFLSGTSGISYNSTTGVISYTGTVYTDASIRALLSGGTGISYNSSTGAISYSGTVYTDSSVRALISMTTTGTSGASTYNNTTGVINVPEYTLAGLGGITASFLSGGTGITYNSSTGSISYSGTVYTDASIRALFSASGSVSYNNTTGVISLTGGNLTEATSSVLTITGGSGAVIGGGTSIQVKQATTSVSGFLSSTDWTTFNNKQATVTLTTTGTSGAATFSSNTLNIPQYAAALSGTTNYVAKFTSSSGIGNSSINDVSGASLTIFKNAAAITDPIIVISPTTGTNASILNLDNAGAGSFYIGRQNSAGNSILMSGLGAYASVLGHTGTQTLHLITNSLSRLSVDGSGNVGIGTSSPSQKLTVSDNSANDLILQVRNLTSGYGTNLFLQGNDNSGAAYNSIVSYTFGGTRHWGIGGGGSVGTFVIDTNGSERMRITSAGNVGINNTDPQRLLHITNTNTGTVTDALMLHNNGNAGYAGNGVRLIFKCGNFSDGEYRSYATIEGVTDAANNPSIALVFKTPNYGILFHPNERMRITGGGNILMGTSSDNGERLYVAGAIRATGTITANSDLTLKKNLLKIENALEKVEQINGYTYELKEDDSKRHGGVIAQEIDKVFPEIVNTGNDGLMGVEYGNISALLIEAIKEQQTQIKELKALLNK